MQEDVSRRERDEGWDEPENDTGEGIKRDDPEPAQKQGD